MPTPQQTNSRTLSPGLDDVTQSLTRWRFWCFLAWQDIKQRYRGSLIGPFWTAANLALIVAGIGILWAGIFGRDAKEYIPFLAAGMTAWFMLANSISEGGNAFIHASSIIRQTNVPLFSFPLRVVTRNLIVLAHNSVVFIGVAIVFKVVPNFLWLIPGLAILVLNVGWMVTISALIGTRYRDAGQLITHLTQFFMFLTPIFWFPEDVDGLRSAFIIYNPCAHLLEVVRTPLLGGAPSLISVQVSLALVAVGWLLALTLFTLRRSRIVFWL